MVLTQVHKHVRKRGPEENHGLEREKAGIGD